MAGSYGHIVNEDGSLLSDEGINGMLECNPGDVVECVEELYGMIWYLATKLNLKLPDGDPRTTKGLVSEAEENYKLGLAWSPTKGSIW